MAIRPEYNLLCSCEGVLISMTKRQYLESIRKDGANIKLIGKVIPVNKTDIKWREVNVKEKIIYRKRFTKDHATQLSNLVNNNLPYLANKSAKNFLKNFYSLVINKMNKSFPVDK